MYILILVLILIIPTLLHVYFSRQASDPYGSFHVSFNKIPGGPDPPRTEWLNMGFWKSMTGQDTVLFPEACQALALQLFQVASLKPGGRVLDVGHGSGDSILLQLSHPDVARPALLCGITSLSSHYRRAQERVDSFLSSVDAPSETPGVLLFEGDAVWRPGDKARSHPLSPHFQYEFDNVLALDCAYHFNTRHEFLRQSFQRLVPGGGIALADICCSTPPGPILTLLLWRVLRVMPRDNIVTKEQYIQQMNNIGYEGVEMEDITPFVFPGFCNFLKWRGYVGTVFAWLMGWLQGQGLRFIIIKGAKPSVH